MNTWIMTLNLTRDENRKFLDQIIDKGIGQDVKLVKTKNAQNIEDIGDGDLVYLRYGGSGEQSDNNLVRGLYAILQKTGDEKSENRTSFTVKYCYGLKTDAVNSEKYYTTMLPHDLFDNDFKHDLLGKLASSGKNSISDQKDPEFVNSFVNSLNELKLKAVSKVLGL